MNYWRILIISIILITSVQNDNVSVVDGFSTVSDSVVKVYDEDLSEVIYNSVTEESYKNFIVKLTENGSRWTENGQEVKFSDANIYARRIQ
jgi:hypothetical protein